MPQNKSVIDVFSDFIHYLYGCAKSYICNTHPNGESLWASVEQRIEFVLSHPNGWQGAEQALLRKAVVQAELVPNTNGGYARIHFITEGKASLLFCIQLGLTIDAVKVRLDFCYSWSNIVLPYPSLLQIPIHPYPQSLL